MTGTLWVVSSNFQESYAEFDTNGEGMSGPPQQVQWCGNDTLVMNWDGVVLMVGPFGSTLRLVNRIYCDGRMILMCGQILLQLADISHI